MQVDQSPRREVVADHTGPAAVESYTVMHDHTGPTEALVAALTSDGRRTWARSTDVGVISAFLTAEQIGQPVHIAAGMVSALG